MKIELEHDVLIRIEGDEEGGTLIATKVNHSMPRSRFRDIVQSGLTMALFLLAFYAAVCWFCDDILGGQ